MRIAVMGSTKGTSTEKLFEHGLVSLVVSNKSDAGILQRANAAKVPAAYIQGPSKKSNRSIQDFEQELTALFEKQKIELIIMVGFMLILSEKFIQRWKGKIINVHPSLLPKFAGGMDLNVHEAVIKSKEEYSGCTVHFAIEQADAGPIIVQSQCMVDFYAPVQTAAEVLKSKVQALEKEALVTAVNAFMKNPNLYEHLLAEEQKYRTWLPLFSNSAVTALNVFGIAAVALNVYFKPKHNE